MVKLLQSKGYDSIVYENEYEDIGEDSYILFDKKQITLIEIIETTLNELVNKNNMSEDIHKMIDKVRNYGEKYDPQYVYDYINKMHKSGWEKRKFDDSEWVLSHEYFLLKDVSLDDPTIKWNFGQHPPVVNNYSKLETEIPPIVIGSNGYIIDGTHRAGAAKLKGDKTIKAFVGF